MPDPSTLDLVSGTAAQREVAADRFWSTVVRRHADVDVVVLPPEAPRTPEVPADAPRTDPAVARQELRARTAALWHALDLAAEPTHLEDAWLTGGATGTLRWQGTASFDGLDPVLASGALERARDLLEGDETWHVLVPPDGIARVLAGRSAPIGREELQVLVPSTSRVVVRFRSEVLVVGAEAAAVALRGDER